MAKLLFILLVTVLVAQALSNPQLCPYPSKALKLAYSEDVHIPAPEFGRTEKVITIPSPEGTISCITLSTFDDPSGVASIASVGVSDEELTIKLVSSIKGGIEVQVMVYSK